MRNSLKTPLTQAQMLVLQVVKEQYNEQDLDELKQLLIDFNHKKMQKHLDESVANREYTDEDFEKILKGHDRKAR